MAKKDVHVVPHDDGWAYRIEGNSRVSRTFDTKKEATDAGRTRAQEEHVELVIHNRNGRISDSDSYGGDSRRWKDKVH